MPFTKVLNQGAECLPVTCSAKTPQRATQILSQHILKGFHRAHALRPQRFEMADSCVLYSFRVKLRNLPQAHIGRVCPPVASLSPGLGLTPVTRWNLACRSGTQASPPTRRRSSICVVVLSVRVSSASGPVVPLSPSLPLSHSLSLSRSLGPCLGRSPSLSPLCSSLSPSLLSLGFFPHSLSPPRPEWVPAGAVAFSSELLGHIEMGPARRRTAAVRQSPFSSHGTVVNE